MSGCTLECWMCVGVSPESLPSAYKNQAAQLLHCSAWLSPSQTSSLPCCPLRFFRGCTRKNESADQTREGSELAGGGSEPRRQIDRGSVANGKREQKKLAINAKNLKELTQNNLCRNHDHRFPPPRFVCLFTCPGPNR